MEENNKDNKGSLSGTRRIPQISDQARKKGGPESVSAANRSAASGNRTASRSASGGDGAAVTRSVPDRGSASAAGSAQKNRSDAGRSKAGNGGTRKSRPGTPSAKRKLSRRRQQQRRMRRLKLFGAAAAILLVIIIGIIVVVSNGSKKPSTNNKVNEPPEIYSSGEAESSTGEEETAEETQSGEEPGSDAAEQPADDPGQNAEGGETVYATARVNIRTVPDTSGDILGKLEAGASIVRTADENGWSTVNYNGTTAYISSDFLTTDPVPAESAPAVTGAVTAPTLADGLWDLSGIPRDDTALLGADKPIAPFGFTANHDENNVPTDWMWYESKWGQFNVDWIQDTTSKTIYLTMDEGFGNDNTITILDTLKEKGVKATFFLTQYFVEECPELVQRMIDEGHMLGNHTCTHPEMPSLTDEEQTAQVMTLHNMVKDQFGYEMKLFRFPEGHYTSYSLALVNNLGYKAVFWSYAYLDYDTENQPDVETSLQAALDALHPGAIYLLHANSDTNTAFLGRFIDGARERGFTFADQYPLEWN